MRLFRVASLRLVIGCCAALCLLLARPLMADSTGVEALSERIAVLEKKLNDSQAEAKALRAELDALRTATPTAKGKVASTPPPAAEKPNAPKATKPTASVPAADSDSRSDVAQEQGNRFLEKLIVVIFLAFCASYIGAHWKNRNQPLPTDAPKPGPTYTNGTGAETVVFFDKSNKAAATPATPPAADDAPADPPGNPMLVEPPKNSGTES